MQEISYTKKYYEIYKGGSYELLFVVETKEVAEQICKEHKLRYEEKYVQVAAGSCTSGCCVLD